MKLLALVQVDTNDGDYMTELTEIEDPKLINRIAEAVSKFEPYESVGRGGTKWSHDHNYPFNCAREDLGEKTPQEIYVESGLLTEEELEEFESNYVPYPEMGFHSIVEIRILEVSNDTKLC